MWLAYVLMRQHKYTQAQAPNGKPTVSVGYNSRTAMVGNAHPTILKPTMAIIPRRRHRKVNPPCRWGTTLVLQWWEGPTLLKADALFVGFLLLLVGGGDIEAVNRANIQRIGGIEENFFICVDTEFGGN
jgi:hypothetical protein